MLKDHPTHTTLPAQDLDRALAFYRDQLGFEPEEESAGVFFRSGKTRFLVFPSSGQASGDHTQMSWTVTDIRAEVDELSARGVEFEQYDRPDFKTEAGVVRTAGLQAAWFKDSEGNLLGLVQLD